MRRAAARSTPGAPPVQVPGASDEVAVAITAAITTFLAQETDRAEPTAPDRAWMRAARRELVGWPSIVTQADLER